MESVLERLIRTIFTTHAAKRGHGKYSRASFQWRWNFVNHHLAHDGRFDALMEALGPVIEESTVLSEHFFQEPEPPPRASGPRNFLKVGRGRRSQWEFAEEDIVMSPWHRRPGHP